jgi:glycosyltransferase involved in cell wall biosynthesis
MKTASNLPPTGCDRRLVVAVLTFRRPYELGRILPVLVDQVAAVAADAELLVIDNDPKASAAELVSTFDSARYFHEPRPGIAAARNRALDEAISRGAQALVFIDDDEIPGSEWLSTLVAAWVRWGCAAVSGPVISIFDRQPRPWILASRAFEPRIVATGAEVPGAATNNLLLDIRQVLQMGLRFDDRLGLTGGEDTMFTHQLVAAGGQIRWCAEAVVLEPVLPSRATRRWVLRRSFRAGASWSGMELTLAGGKYGRSITRLKLTAKSVVNSAVGALTFLVGISTGNVARQARGACKVLSYLGLFVGAVGCSYAEYRRPRGTNGDH